MESAALISQEGSKDIGEFSSRAKESQNFLTEEGGGDAHVNRKTKDLKIDIDETRFATSTPKAELSKHDVTPDGDVKDKCESQFPSTVTVLNAPDGGQVYLVGTAHFSIKSQQDVAEVIRKVNPHVVMVELCEQRTNILLLDEKVILEEAKNINIRKIRETIATNGVFKGVMYILLLNMSAHITRELGMAPGGEFRIALQEAKKLSNCIVQLGDRPIDVTVHRAMGALTWPQTIRFVWHLLTSNQAISPEDIEKCKQQKMLDEMLEEMAEEFPPLKQVFVTERDMYLCHSLQLAANHPRGEPCRVVGVVGMGHVAGIAQYWGQVTSADIQPLLRIPPASLSTRVVRVSVQAACVGAAIYVLYRFFPRSLLKW